MQKINFIKMVASGNDFVVIDNRHKVTKSQSYKALAQKICDRKFGLGADGLLLLEKSKRANLKMRIFNADGSEAEMCGNGARCVAFWLNAKRKSAGSKFKIETKAGIIATEVIGNRARIRLSDPKDIELDIPLKVYNRNLKVNFINTGVPHTVIFVQGLEKIDVFNLGQAIRYHKGFVPEGTNVDFVEVLGHNSIAIRTYELGVEDETLACGTGSAAAALIFTLQTKAQDKIYIHTRGKEILAVYFKRTEDRFSEVWLEGKAGIVFQGRIAY